MHFLFKIKLFFQYYCDEAANVPYIERVDEPSTCSYIITIKTNLICAFTFAWWLSKLNRKTSK